MGSVGSLAATKPSPTGVWWPPCRLRPPAIAPCSWGTDLVVQDHCEVRNRDMDQVPWECLLWDVFGMWNCRLLPEFPACAGQTALMDQGSVLLCRENWGKKCPLPEAWASVPRGLCWGAISSCLPSWRGIGNPCRAWRVCSVTCTDVFLFHNNHFTSCLENGAFWLCACMDQCSCLRAGPGGRVGLESLQGTEQV